MSQKVTDHPRSALDVCLDVMFGRVEAAYLQDFLKSYPAALDLMVAARQHGSFTPEMIKEHLGAALNAVPEADLTRELFRLVEFVTATTRTINLKPLPVIGEVVVEAEVAAPPANKPTSDWPPSNTTDGSLTQKVLIALGPASQLRTTLIGFEGSIGKLRKELKKKHGIPIGDGYLRSILLKFYGLKAMNMDEFLQGATSKPVTTPSSDWPPANARKGSNSYAVLEKLGNASALRETLARLEGSISDLRKELAKVHKIKVGDTSFRAILTRYYGLNSSNMVEFLAGNVNAPTGKKPKRAKGKRTRKVSKPKRKYTRRATPKSDSSAQSEPKNVSQLIRQMFTADDLESTLVAQQTVSGLAKYINGLPEVKAARFSISEANCSMLFKNVTGKNASAVLGTRKPTSRR